MTSSIIRIHAQKKSLDQITRMQTCPACHYAISVPFYEGSSQALTTLAWPTSHEQAIQMKKLPLDFVQCVSCSHIFNARFNYQEIPYSEKPNLMFNQGTLWRQHLDKIMLPMLSGLGKNPTIVEIGCGDGHFLKAISSQLPDARLIGFDPHPSANNQDPRLELYKELFEPTLHMAQFKPDLVIMRHVLEHLTHPLQFLQSIAFASSYLGLNTRLFVEVPCVDRAVNMHRTTDFFYEHYSHFTHSSLKRMMQACHADILNIELSYDDEVIYAIGTLDPTHHQQHHTQEAIAFDDFTKQRDRHIRAQIENLAIHKDTIAIWGGTGKAAAFIHRYGLDHTRFPIVVDSDLNKVGTFVPGSGQEIRNPNYLHTHPANTILIATQWRARDIALEIQRRGINVKNLLLEHQGQLVDFYSGVHPYGIDKPTQTLHKNYA